MTIEIPRFRSTRDRGGGCVLPAESKATGRTLSDDVKSQTPMCELDSVTQRKNTNGESFRISTPAKLPRLNGSSRASFRKEVSRCWWGHRALSRVRFQSYWLVPSARERAS